MVCDRDSDVFQIAFFQIILPRRPFIESKFFLHFSNAVSCVNPNYEKQGLFAWSSYVKSNPAIWKLWRDILERVMKRFPDWAASGFSANEIEDPPEKFLDSATAIRDFVQIAVDASKAWEEKL